VNNYSIFFFLDDLGAPRGDLYDDFNRNIYNPKAITYFDSQSNTFISNIPESSQAGND